MLFCIIAVFRSFSEYGKLDKKRKEMLRLRDAIQRNPESDESFIIRFTSPTNWMSSSTIHHSSCRHAYKAGTYLRTSTWIGYFQTYEDAKKYALYSIFSPYDCGVCRPELII